VRVCGTTRFEEMETSTLFGIGARRITSSVVQQSWDVAREALRDARVCARKSVVADVPSVLLKITFSSFHAMLHVCDCSHCTVVRVDCQR
jgi:hypothetical protein